MRRFVMGVSILLFLGIAAAMAISFLLNAVEVMHGASKIDPAAFVRFKNNPIKDLGYAGAALIASIGVLLVCLKYALRRVDGDSTGDDDENDAAETPEDEEASDRAKLEEWKRTHKL